ncbi:FecR family protein [Brevundimonas staleyi]|uniref:FecR family protein n=1 Tax=Brevundimonas staleyi TaxID=74326 RepID=A0ABW0FY53_9CAUL
MVERVTSRDIDAAAAAWVAREDRAPLSDGDTEALNAWLVADSRHAGALLRARAVALRSESARALGEAYDPAAFGASIAQAPVSRRRALIWGGSATASIGLASLVGLGLAAPTAHATARGEVRLVPLADGSTIMMNTQTRLTVKYDERRRNVRLLEGEVDLSVVADARPFVVEIGDQRVVVAHGAGVRLRKLGQAMTDILVHQGQVEVSSAGRSTPMKMGPNTRMQLTEAGPFSPSTSSVTVSPDVVTRELAWRDGKIAFEGETLAEAAATFARYSDTRIVILDEALAREPITGLFAANDPIGFGRAIGGVFDVPVVERKGALLIGRDGAVG